MDEVFELPLRPPEMNPQDPLEMAADSVASVQADPVDNLLESTDKGSIDIAPEVALDTVATREPDLHVSSLASKIIETLWNLKRTVKVDALVGIIQAEYSDIGYRHVAKALTEIGGEGGLMKALGLSHFWVDQKNSTHKKPARKVGFSPAFIKAYGDVAPRPSAPDSETEVLITIDNSRHLRGDAHKEGALGAYDAKSGLYEVERDLLELILSKNDRLYIPDPLVKKHVKRVLRALAGSAELADPQVKSRFLAVNNWLTSHTGSYEPILLEEDSGRKGSLPESTIEVFRDPNSACSQMSDLNKMYSLFFPERGQSTLATREICLGCTALRNCAEYALQHKIRFGMWGGLSERQRRMLRKMQTTHIQEEVTKKMEEFWDQARAKIKARKQRQ